MEVCHLHGMRQGHFAALCCGEAERDPLRNTRCPEECSSFRCFSGRRRRAPSEGPVISLILKSPSARATTRMWKTTNHSFLLISAAFWSPLPQFLWSTAQRCGASSLCRWHQNVHKGSLWTCSSDASCVLTPLRHCKWKCVIYMACDKGTSPHFVAGRLSGIL